MRFLQSNENVVNSAYVTLKLTPAGETETGFLSHDGCRQESDS